MRRSISRIISTCLAIVLFLQGASFPQPSRSLHRSALSNPFTNQALSPFALSAHLIILAMHPRGHHFVNFASLILAQTGPLLSAPSPESADVPAPPPLPHPSEAALRVVETVIRLPFLRRVFALSAQLIREIRTFYLSGTYEHLRSTVTTNLTDEQKVLWKAHLEKILRRDVRIVSGPTAQLTRVADDGVLEVNESLLAFSLTTNDVAYRNRMLSWVFSKDLAMDFIRRRPNSWRVWGFKWLARRFGHRSLDAQEEFAASLLAPLTGLGYYARLDKEFKPLQLIPAVAVETLLNGIRATQPLSAEDEVRVREAYEGAHYCYLDAEKAPLQYPTGENYFDHATRIAEQIARIGRGPEGVIVALFHRMTPEGQRIFLARVPRVDKEYFEQTFLLIEGLTHIRPEPFRPRVPAAVDPDDTSPNRRIDSDFSLQFHLNRQIKVITDEASSLASKHFKKREVTEDERNALVRRFSATLFTLLLYEKYLDIATIPPSDRETLLRSFQEIELLLVPQAERLGLRVTAGLLDNEAFHAVFPDLYQAADDEYRAAMLSQAEDEALLKDRQAAAGELVEALGIKPITIRARQKTRARAWSKRQERRAEQVRQGLPPTSTIGEQRDLLALMVVVETPAELERIKDLTRSLGQPFAPGHPFNKKRAFWSKGEVTYRIETFGVPNPRKPEELKPIELQMLTREAYENYLYGQQEVRYREAHWKTKLRRTANVVAAIVTGDMKTRWNINFFTADPALSTTGTLAYDLEQNWAKLAASLADENYPISPEDRFGRPITDLSGIRNAYWAIDRIRGVVADWAFSPHIGGQPQKFRRPFALTLSGSADDPEGQGLGATRGSLLPLNAPLASNPIFMLNVGHDESLSNWTLPAATSLHDLTQTTHARMLVAAYLRVLKYPTMAGSRGRPTYLGRALQETQIANWEREGLDLIKGRFGKVDNLFLTNLLEPMVAWQGFSSVAELYRAIGAQPSLLDELSEWYKARFVEITCDVDQREHEQDLLVTIDEKQTGLLVDIAATAADRGWNLLPGVDIRPQYESGKLTLRLPVNGNPQEDIKALAGAIRNLRRPRGQRQPIENAERRLMRVDLLDRPGTLATILKTLDAQHVDVESIRGVGRRDDSHIIEFELSGPDSSDMTDESINSQLAEKLAAVKSEFETPAGVENVALARNIRIGLFSELEQFNFDLGRLGRSVIVTETSRAEQLGILADVVRLIKEAGWDITASRKDFIHMGLSDAGEYALRIALKWPRGTKPEQFKRLQTMLNSLRRFSGEQPAIPGTRATLHLWVRENIACVSAVLDTLAALGVNLVSLTTQPASGDRHQWWALEVTIPHHLPEPESRMPRIDIPDAVIANRSPAEAILAALKNLRTETGDAVVPDIEVLWTMNGNTIAHAKAMLKGFLEWPQERQDWYFAQAAQIPQESDETEDLDGAVDWRFLDQLQKAYVLGARLHAGQTRADGSPFISHSIELAYGLLHEDGIKDPMTILAAILHDALEDAPEIFLKANPHFAAAAPEEDRLALARQLVESEIAREFPMIESRLLPLINAMTKRPLPPNPTSAQRVQINAEHMAALKANPTLPVVAMVLRDRMVNLMNPKFGHLNNDHRVKQICDTLSGYLGLASWPTEPKDYAALMKDPYQGGIYLRNHRQFLFVLMRDVASLPTEDWKRVMNLVPRTPELHKEIDAFIPWLLSHPELQPPASHAGPEISQLFVQRLLAIRTQGPDTAEISQDKPLKKAPKKKKGFTLVAVLALGLVGAVLGFFATDHGLVYITGVASVIGIPNAVARWLTRHRMNSLQPLQRSA